MQNEAFLEIAKELKSARENKGVEISQISNKTRIDAKYLKLMEEGDFDYMPDVYMKAFVKEFADSLGLDGAEMVNKYKAAKFGRVEQSADDDLVSTKTDEPVREFGSGEGENTVPGEVSKNNNQLVYLAVAFLFIITVVIVYFAVIKDGSTEFYKENTSSKQQETPAEKRFVEKKPELKPDSKPAAVDPSEGPLKVRVETSDTLWLRVKLDDQQTNEYMMYPNTSKNFDALSEFRFVVGNSSAVKFFLNGNQLQFSGNKGTVKNVIIDKNGIRK